MDYRLLRPRPARITTAAGRSTTQLKVDGALGALTFPHEVGYTSPEVRFSSVIARSEID
ncbi:MAG: hypothetical protein Q8R91_08840 [Candidatus Omnitrophota bacterium]|nr:hypothetical protein [Candidatus Omnitrophota bacterium]